MKKTIISTLAVAFTMAQADCSTMPVGMELAKSIEAKEVSKAKDLLAKYKEDVKKYLASCDQSKEKFEETSVMIHTYEDRLVDVEYDMKKENHTTDCSKIPNSTKLEEAFKKADASNLTSLYDTYKKDAEGYIENCASHEEYETVYEASMFYEDEYATWKETHK